MYFCAFGLLLAIPLAYLVCQVLTWCVYEGRWRRWSLVPIAVVALALLPLAFVRDVIAVCAIGLGAPIAGLIALGCVWAAYSSAQERAAAGPVEGSAEAATDSEV